MKRDAFWLSIVGLVMILGGMVVFSVELSSVPSPNPREAEYLSMVGGWYLVAVFVGTALILFGLGREARARLGEVRERGTALLWPSWAIPYLLSLRRYRWAFLLSSLGYGLFYALITSMIVYQPGVDFAQTYGVVVPSATVTPVSAAPLFTPILTAYVTDHLGLLLIPLTALLAVLISVLVGLNSTLAVFAFDSRARGAGKGWLGGVGAAVGLFTGCPTCAGLFFANVLGGAGAVSFATILGYYQPLFILLSIPVLMATPYLISRSLAKVYRDGCVVVPKAQL